MLLFIGMFYTLVLLVVSNLFFGFLYLYFNFVIQTLILFLKLNSLFTILPLFYLLPGILLMWVLFCSRRNGAVSQSPLFFFRLFLWSNVTALVITDFIENIFWLISLPIFYRFCTIESITSIDDSDAQTAYLRWIWWD